MKRQVTEFLDACKLTPGNRSTAELELMTGCSVCGRRLTEAGDHVREEVVVLSILDDDGTEHGALALCGQHAPKLAQRTES